MVQYHPGGQGKEGGQLVQAVGYGTSFEENGDLEMVLEVEVGEWKEAPGLGLDEGK